MRHNNPRRLLVQGYPPDLKLMKDEDGERYPTPVYVLHQGVLTSLVSVALLRAPIQIVLSSHLVNPEEISDGSESVQ